MLCMNRWLPALMLGFSLTFFGLPAEAQDESAEAAEVGSEEAVETEEPASEESATESSEEKTSDEPSSEEATESEPAEEAKPESTEAKPAEEEGSDNEEAEATEEAVDKPGEFAKRPFRPRLPPFFRYVISGLQREKIYQIQGEYHDKIADLEVQIKRLEAERDARIEEVLDQKQLDRVEELRLEAFERRKEQVLGE